MKVRLTPRGLAAAAAVLASQGFTVAAFALAGRRAGMPAAAGVALFWLGALAAAFPVAGVCLVVSLALAALSVLAGGPGLLGVAAAGASVAAWDLSRFATGGAPAADAAGERRLLRSRLLALSAGILPGLALAGLLGQVRLTLPFPVMLGLGVVALVALDRAERRWG